MVKHLKSWHTNQPYVQFSRYLVSGREVVVKMGGMRQSWDCQPFRAKSRILTVDGVTPSASEEADLGLALARAFPDSPLQELANA